MRFIFRTGQRQVLHDERNKFRRQPCNPICFLQSGHIAGGFAKAAKRGTGRPIAAARRAGALSRCNKASRPEQSGGSYRRHIHAGYRNENRLIIGKTDLIETIKAVSTISSEKGRAVRFQLSSGSMTASVNNPHAGRAEQSAPCTWSGDDGFEFGCNWEYLTEIANRVDGDTLELSVSNPGSPILIRAGSGLFVQMPMRV